MWQKYYGTRGEAQRKDTADSKRERRGWEIAHCVLQMAPLHKEATGQWFPVNLSTGK